MKRLFGLALATTLVACGGGGGGGSTTTAVVTPPVTCTSPQVLQNGACVTPVVTAPAPSVAVSISQPKAFVNTPVTVTWSSNNATTCTGLDAMAAGAKATSGSATITPTAGGQYTYTISCDGAGGTAKQSAALVVPMPVLKSSYENKMAGGAVVGPITLPAGSNFTGRGLNAVAYAFGDFLQNGSYQLAVGTVEFQSWIPTAPRNSGHFQFYQMVNGVWVDVTSKLLADNSGCLLPRKAVVADFNGDKKPDVWFTCSGNDVYPYAGEYQKMLLSQSDGTYKNSTIPYTAYAHGGSAADVNGNGYADLVVTNKGPQYLINNKDGTFTEDKSRAPASWKPSPCAYDTRVMCDAPPYGLFSLELIDFNNDGKYDLWTGSIYEPGNVYGVSHIPTVYLNDGTNNFTDVGSIPITPTSTGVLALDVIYTNGKLYTSYYDQATYKNMTVDAYDTATKTVTALYAHVGFYADNSLSPWFAWITMYNNKITSSENGYTLNITVP